MLIWLASYPRSGNTFFRALLYQLHGIVAHDIHAGQDPRDDSHPISAVIGAPAPMPSLDDLAHADTPYFVKTHALPDDDHRAIYLVRDGRDALVSHAHYILDYDRKVAPQEHRDQFLETLNMLVETDVSFGGWSQNVLTWTSRPARTVVVKFEDLIDRPLECFRDARAAIGVEALERANPWIPRFDELRARMPQFFREGRSGTWRDAMPEAVHQRFWERHGDAMRKIGYGRE